MRIQQIIYTPTVELVFKGGTLYGMKSKLEWFEDPNAVPCTLTFRDVDTLAKISEFTCPGVDDVARRKINYFLGDVCDKLNSEYRRLNPMPEGPQS